MPDINKLLELANKGELHNVAPQDSFSESYKTANTSEDKKPFEDIIGRHKNKDKVLTQEFVDNINTLGLSLNDTEAYEQNIEQLENIKAKKLAKEQSGFKQFGNALIQLVGNEIAIGSVKGVFDLYDAVANRFTDEHYQNAVSKYFEGWQDAIREFAPIHTYNRFDSGWWWQGLEQIGSVASIALPVGGLSKGLGFIGKGMKMNNWIPGGLRYAAKLASKSDKGLKFVERGAGAGKILKYPNYYGREINNAIQGAGMAIISRGIENQQEANETYKLAVSEIEKSLNALNKEQYDEFIRRNPDYAQYVKDGKYDTQKIASMIASEAADKVFKNDMVLLAMDVMQWNAINKLFRGAATRNISSAARKANRETIENAAKRTTEAVGAQATKKTFLNTISTTAKKAGLWAKDHAKELSLEMLGEGVEEGYQGSMQAYAENYYQMALDKNVPLRGLESYITDANIWDQFFWGAMGGLLGGNAMKYLNNKSNKIKYDIAKKKGKISPEQYAQYIQSEDEKAITEINGRHEILKELNKQFDSIDNGINPFATTDENHITSEEEREALKQQALTNAVSELTMKAVDAGTINLLTEYLNADNIREMIDSEGNSGVTSQKLIDEFNKTYKAYTENLEDLLNNTSVDNPELLRIMARDLTRLDANIENEQTDIDLKNQNLGLISGQNPSQNLRDYIHFQYLNAALKTIEDKKKQLSKQYEDNELDAFAYNSNIKRLDEISKKYNNLLKELIENSGNINLIAALDSNDIDSVKTIAKDLWYNEEEYNSLPNNVKEELNSLTEAQIALDNRKSLRPKTQQEFEQFYADYEQTANSLLNTKINKAFQTVGDYIKKSSDIDNAINVLFGRTEDSSLSKRQREKLDEAMTILGIGMPNNTQITRLLHQYVGKLKADRQQAEEDENKASNGEQIVENPTKDDNVGNDKPIGEQSSPNDSSKGEVKEDKEGDVTSGMFNEEEITDDTETFPIDEYIATNPLDDTESGEFIGQEWAQRQLDAEVQRIYLERDIQNAFKWVVQNGNIPLSEVINNGISSQQFNDFIEAAVRYLVESQGYNQVEIRDKIIYNFTIYLSKFIGDNSSLNKEAKANIYKMLNELTNISNTFIVKSDFSDISDKSDEQRSKEIEEFLDKYFNLSGYIKQTNKAGSKIINVDTLLKDLLQLAQDGTYNFAQICEIFNNIVNYININKNNPNSKYAFESTSVINGFILDNTIESKRLNVSEFINSVYNTITTEQVLDNHMHFSISNLLFTKDAKGNKQLDIKKLNAAKGKRLFIKDAGGNSISLYYIDNSGNHVEIGFLSKVQKNASNTELSIKARNNLMHRVKKEDGKYRMMNTALEQKLYDIIDASVDETQTPLKEIFNYLYNVFAVKKDGANSIDHDILADYVNMLKNKEFKEFLKLIEEEIDIPTIDFDKGLTNENTKALYIIARKVNEILFYPYNTTRQMGAINPDVLASSLEQYIQKTFENYSRTLDFQTKLENGEKLAGFKFISSDATNLRYDKEESKRKGIANIGLKGSIASHPFVRVTPEGTISVEGVEKPYNNTAGWTPHTMGILLDVKGNSPMVAIFREANKISNQKIKDAITKEFKSYLDAYFKASGTDVEKAYDNLLNFIKSISYSGDGSLFNGWKVSVNKNYFDVYRETGKLDENRNPVRETLGRFYKHNAYWDKDSKSYKSIFTGETIEPSDLENHYGGRVVFIRRKAGKQYKTTIKGNQSKEQQNALESLYANFLTNLTFNRNGYKAFEGQGSGFVTKTNKGYIVKIGDYQQRFVNYADWLVQNNAFTTTHQGTRVTSTYSTSSESGSVYVEYSGTREDITPEEKRSVVGIQFNFDERKVKDGDEISSEDLLLDAGYTPEELKDFDETLKVLKAGKIKLDLANKTAGYASHTKGKITITQRGIDLINGERRNALRLIIHENIHRQALKTDFFKDKYGKARVETLIDTYKQFYDYCTQHPEIVNSNSSLANFVSNFEAKYGKNAESTDETKRIELANEWIAEVMSNGAIMSLLNDIEYTGNYIIENEEEKETLLQKILNVLKDLFINLKHINNNSLLEQFNKALGNVTYTSITEETTTSVQEKTKEQTGEEVDGDTEVGEDDGTSNDNPFDVLDDDDNLLDLSDIEGVDSEIKFNAYLDNPKSNPYGFTLAPTIDDYLQSFPPNERAAIAAELATGKVEYLCR